MDNLVNFVMIWNTLLDSNTKLVESWNDRIHPLNFIASHIMHSLSSLMILHCLVMILRNDSPFQAIQT